jgi:hypothetical protein
VLDVGRGEGHSARFFRDLRCEVVAVHGSRQTRRYSRIPEAHAVHDFHNGPFVLGRDFDLVWSCEFVAHVEQAYSGHLVETFRASRKYILMTCAAPGQNGWHHVNCQPAPYWAVKLREWGFLHDEELTRRS